ncbi:hypothetical protein GDO78_007876 [Eleutherodactylus coqui]|uniref:Uncharacterized protein n=1 Tax=Eleutherodactylus coqui TaxID=57060 RepID=A0A8J6FKE0_ELECQ|nr:hypothetical protein GDO78_007876 [Eleutherodactylus coqui]
MVIQGQLKVRRKWSQSYPAPFHSYVLTGCMNQRCSLHNTYKNIKYCQIILSFPEHKLFLMVALHQSRNKLSLHPRLSQNMPPQLSS